MTVRDDLIALLLPARGHVATADEAIANLRSAPGEEVARALTNTAELLRAQSRRLRSAPDDVHGLDELVAALRGAEAETVDLYVLAESGAVTSVVVGPGGRVLGCVIGPDRRPGATSPR